MSLDAILDLPAVDLDTADAEQKRVLDKAVAAVGFVPNMYKGMVNSPGLLETYLDGYARFRESGVFAPAEQEVVFLAISRANGCDYCVAAHSLIAERKSGVPAVELAALRAGEALADARLQALAAFTRTMLETRGRPDRSAFERFRAAGYGDRHALEIILALAVKTLSNYANHLNGPEVDPAFAPYKV